MPPKKKGNKKAVDDWEAELGESAAPTTAAPTADWNNVADATADDEESGAGGFMALLRKNKEKRKKKGIVDDFVTGEDPPAADGEAGAAPDLSNKAPEEAAIDDEFALPAKKGKGGNQAKPGQKQQAAVGDEDEAGGKLLTKAEKEKLKKEKEKQRKKEQVRSDYFLIDTPYILCIRH
jgi:translation initiation factor 5B